MDIKKIVQIVGYVLAKYNGRLNYTKLIKILYLADREAMKASGYPITGDNYVSMSNGVVLSGIYNLIKDDYSNKTAQNLWDSRFTTDGFDLVMICNAMPTGLLSDFEIRTLDAIDEKFHNQKFGKLIDYIHNPKNCPEWEQTDSSIPLDKSRIYSVLGYSDEEIQSLAEEERFYAAEKVMIDSLKEPTAVRHG